MRYLRFRNWERFQHYKDRNPLWIKLYQSLLDDYEFSQLDDASRLLAFYLMLLAARTNNKIPSDPEWIKSRCSLGKKPLNLGDLICMKLIEEIEEVGTNSVVLASGYQDAIPETETYKEETEKRQKKKGTPLPSDFKISERVKAWADSKGLTGLEDDLEFFVGRMKANGKTYLDWDEAFMNCVREDWAGLRKKQ